MSSCTPRFCLALVVLFSVVVPHSGFSKPSQDKEVTIRRQIEPRYPVWAYTHGIGQGYAKVAFYVDEFGEASEFFAIEYSYEAFAEELLSTVRNWQFVPAERNGVPVKTVCHAYWEFLPDRAIETNALFDTSKRMGQKGGEGFRALKFREGDELDARIRMLSFPGLAVVRGSGLLEESRASVRARVNLFVDAGGGVVLPQVVDTSDPQVSEMLERAFKEAAFEIPVYKGEGTIAMLERTYDFPVVWVEEEPARSL